MEHLRGQISQVREQEHKYGLDHSNMRCVFGNEGAEHSKQYANKNTSDTDNEELQYTSKYINHLNRILKSILHKHVIQDLKENKRELDENTGTEGGMATMGINMDH